MDFFQRQQIARRNTHWLEVYLVLAMTATIALVYSAVVGLCFLPGGDNDQAASEPVSWWNPELLFAITVMTVSVIALGCFYKMRQLARGGSVVAESLGAVPINPQRASLAEQRLIHVVEEMAIASGTPVPKLYLLPQDQTINAFAAGHSTSDMAICVTAGALQYLTRDELEGVIGHEFSHILNGDMHLNLRLMGIIYGMIVLAIVGRLCFQLRGGKKNPLPLFGLMFMAVGWIGVFFSKLIKSAVSRQREFLADASSVQFTRNPAGLATALKKVGGAGSILSSPHTEDASHLFFANGLRESYLGWWSTHPPLKRRILELDPVWDGNFITPLVVSDSAASPASRPAATPPVKTALAAAVLPAIPAVAAGIVTTGAVLSQVGLPTARHLDYAANVMASIPPALTTAARDPSGAAGLIYALMLSRDDGIRTQQFQQLQADPAVVQELIQLYPSLGNLEPRARLPLVTLSIPALLNLSPAQYGAFEANFQALAALDGAADLFTFMLRKVVLNRLQPHFKPAPKKLAQVDTLAPLLPDCAVLLSALACVGQTDAAARQQAFGQGARQLGDPSVVPLRFDPSAYELGRIDAALDRLKQASPPIKKNILAACAETIAADGIIQEEEAELLRAFADTLDCPIPPFLTIE